jgi:cytochrome oxidase Cu insertion factor (SCO1/SenC/PrrC family)
MKTFRRFLTIALMSIVYLLPAQLPDGSVAPDFTLKDLNGNNHTLYDYLNQGKTVYIDFSAAHCPSCWAYHNTNALKNLYLANGPTGTTSQDVMVLFIELDPNNGLNELLGVSGSTQGDWITGKPYPFFNPEGADRKVIDDYKAYFYPMIYGICPDKTTKYLGQQNATQLYAYTTNSCKTNAISNPILSGVSIYPNPVESVLKIENTTREYTVSIQDMTGRIIETKSIAIGQTDWDVNALPTGMYLLEVKDEQHSYYQKFLKQ